MALPNPDRTFPNTDAVGPPGPTGADYADKVAAEGQALWDRVPNTLINIGGSANAITAECDPPLVADVQHGQRFWLVPAANNGAGGVTLDTDSRGALPVLAFDGTALEEDDLVAGEGVELAGYATGSPAVVSELRLPHPTARQLLALASAGGSSLWEQIGDSGDLGTVANVEFTFTADRYSRVLVAVSNLVAESTSARHLVCTLRNAGGSIISLQTTDISGVSASENVEFTGKVEFVISVAGATKRHIGWGYVACGVAAPGSATDEAQTINQLQGVNATSPDRVRVEISSSNIVSGRVIAYGLLATAP